MTAELPEMKLLKGAFDMHNHSSPDAVPRRLDEIEHAKMAKEYGMRGLLLKCNQGDTAGRAYLVRKVVPNMDLFGGLVLNYYAGGLNPHAVANCIEFGGKCIWGPTRSAKNQLEMLKAMGGFTGMVAHISSKYEQKLFFEKRVEGITALTPQGEVREELKEIFGMVADADIIFATAHFSPQETMVLVPEAKNVGVKKLCITHPRHLKDESKPRSLGTFTLGELKTLTNMGANLDLIYLTLGTSTVPITRVPGYEEYTAKDMAELIRAVGADHCTLGSDLGQVNNPPPPEGMRIFIRLLLDAGISENEIKTMACYNPAKLLGLPPPTGI